MFLLANSVAMPIVFGGLFQLSLEEISSLIQRTFFIVGISSFLQGWIGHRLPIADGPAGTWVSLFAVLADIAIRQGQNPHDTLPALSGAVLIAGVLLFVLGLAKVTHRLAFLFTPLVTGTFLLILAIQLSGVFMKGMFGLTTGQVATNYAVTGLAGGVFVFVLLLSLLGKGVFKQYAVMIGLLTGWLLYELLGLRTAGIPFNTGEAWLQVPGVFVWGIPKVDLNIVIAVVLFTFMLVSNSVAAVTAVEEATTASPADRPKRLNRGGIIGGISHGLASVFSTIAVVQLPVSAGFIRMTEQRNVKPFLWAGILFAGLSFFPFVVKGLALLPGPIASAALLTTFVQMVGIAMQGITREPLDQRSMSILGISLVTGVGLMALPGAAFQALPAPFQYVLGNGLLFGTVVAICLEQIWRKANVPRVS
ncbi:xanthine permease [Tumebacillus algifaecis]|uniref:Xanthine permease n=2 Tax=Tumebacillus algifaecis TaxID=1214604 RepID=A0A223D6L0_9BACL|nr:xanthine permease [Tumebacillus algifaecis]